MSDTPVALVTGGARGIGAACTQALAKEGFRLAIHHRSSGAAAEALAAELPDAVAFAADLSVPEDVDGLIAALKDEMGRVDVLVNNAGVNRNAPTPSMKLEDFDFVAALSRGTWYLTKLVLRRFMLRQKTGRIINISSVVGHTGNRGQSPYTMAKAGLDALTKSLAPGIGGARDSDQLDRAGIHRDRHDRGAPGRGARGHPRARSPRSDGASRRGRRRRDLPGDAGRLHPGECHPRQRRDVRRLARSVPSVLVAGCGYLGLEVGRRLEASDVRVQGVRRSAGAASEIPCDAVDLAEPGAAREWLRNRSRFDAVVVCVAARSADEAGYRRAYVDVLRGLRDAFGDRPPPLLFTGSTSVYAQDDGEWVDEDSATEPSGYRGAVHLEAEALVAAWPSASCALRLGGLYGPGRTRLAAGVRDGTAAAPAATAYTNRIHRDDAAATVVHLLDRIRAGKEIPPRLVVVDDEPAARSDVIAWLAGRLGVSAPIPRRGAASGKRCRNARLRELGATLAYPTFREGYAAVLSGDPAFPTFSER